MDLKLVELSLLNYQKIAEKMREIDQALHTRSSVLIANLHEELNTLYESARATDRVILDMVRKNPQNKEDKHLSRLLALMETVHRANQKMNAQLHSILAVHRDELQKMKKGNSLLQGYRPAAIHTGKRISISN